MSQQRYITAGTQAARSTVDGGAWYTAKLGQLGRDAPASAVGWSITPGFDSR